MTRDADRDEQLVRELLVRAGARPEVPEEHLSAIVGTARREWRSRYGRDRSRLRSGRIWWLGAAAAAVIAGIGLFWLASFRGPIPATVATVARLSGTVTDAAGRPVAIAASLPAGTQLSTGAGPEADPGRVALDLAGGASLRVDAGTRLRLAGGGLIELEAGAVYVDSGRDHRGSGVAVLTSAGRFQEIGTQFEVRIGGDGEANLRVREGKVELRRANDPAVTAGAGEELEVRSSGEVIRGTVALSGGPWQWVLATAPPLAIEGLPVRAFLDWVARETGWRVELEGEAATLVDEIRLHGSIGRLTPEEAPAVVLPSCGLTHQIEDGALLVSAVAP